MSSNILVIDDDPRITALLKRTLLFNGYTVEAANDGKAGITLLENNHFDLVILDVMMPGLDGWQVCGQIREYYDLPVLMLTARDEVEDRVKGLDLGADDYLVKPFAMTELLARIRALLRRSGKTEAQPAILSYADLSMDTGTREVFRNKRQLNPTAREYELLKLFMENPRLVLNKELIMERIWGYDYQGESNVLEVYIVMLRNKLEACGEKRLIHTVRGAGYVLKE
ncbi:two component transcriptional regulator, winged helix family [Desulfofarcimen acetoxidans DSM 771]|uniref:Stage 0 sporulation protein A homolog n=1 Tax=Desulfofarcimen acetoxidans (strain ATCC 49208 / DSM 771 / KCTC 5769 / VKM B-1644 / 5575) TaxID=485916 RepID=C8W6G4_DESAS|nr:response regulator transcription factor [Desulfofarcimen acetoxidans]ACV62253.1 two component transcriptional regulator, winged helix family [Desulfofarcimen acetoxidans DSM 771]